MVGVAVMGGSKRHRLSLRATRSLVHHLYVGIGPLVEGSKAMDHNALVRLLGSAISRLNSDERHRLSVETSYTGASDDISGSVIIPILSDTTDDGFDALLHAKLGTSRTKYMQFIIMHPVNPVIVRRRFERIVALDYTRAFATYGMSLDQLQTLLDLLVQYNRTDVSFRNCDAPWNIGPLGQCPCVTSLRVTREAAMPELLNIDAMPVTSITHLHLQENRFMTIPPIHPSTIRSLTVETRSMYHTNIAHYISACVNLKEFHYVVHGIYSVMLLDIPSPALETVSITCRELRDVPISDATLQRIQSLSLRKCMLQRQLILPNLEKLDLMECRVDMFPFVPVLKALSMHNVTQHVPLPHMPLLETLDCGNVRNVNIGPALQNVPMLREIHLGLVDLPSLPDLSGTALVELHLRHCAGLTSIGDVPPTLDDFRLVVSQPVSRIPIASLAAAQILVFVVMGMELAESDIRTALQSSRHSLHTFHYEPPMAPAVPAIEAAPAAAATRTLDLGHLIRNHPVLRSITAVNVDTVNLGHMGWASSLCRLEISNCTSYTMSNLERCLTLTSMRIMAPSLTSMVTGDAARILRRNLVIQNSTQTLAVIVAWMNRNGGMVPRLPQELIFMLLFYF